MKKLFLLLTFFAFIIAVSGCEMLEGKRRVSFYSDNELVSQIWVQDNEKIEPPSVPFKKGYEIDGWYQDLEDINSKWNFANDVVSGNTRLDAKWVLVSLAVKNVKLVDEVLIWDEISGASYEVIILEEIITVNENSFSLSSYKNVLQQEKKIGIKPIKDGYPSITTEVKVTYNLEKAIEAYRIDFDVFDYPDFYELNRSSFKSSVIDHDDHYLEVKQGRLTKENEVPKNGVVALILGENGSLELKEAYENFAKLEFNLGGFQNRLMYSKMDVFASNDQDSWYLVNSFSTDVSGFKNYYFTANDLPTSVNKNALIYIRFVADINTTTQTPNLVIDDVVVYQNEKAHFSMSLVEEGITLSDYYISAEGLTGKSLFDELRIIISTNLNDIKYKDIKEILEFSDIKLDDPSKVVGIYDQRLLKANWGTKSEWHREHVWPNSRLGMERVKETGVNQGSDPHNLRAIYPSTNSSRSNRYFDTSSENTLGHTIAKDRYYPGDKDKGDVARILLYMVVRYEFLNLTNHVSLLENKAYTIEAAYMGLLSNLLTWHNQDSVDDFERNRNEVIYSYQRNRNPFIDHPELFVVVYEYLVLKDEQITIYDYRIFIVKVEVLLNEEKSAWFK